MENKVIIIIIIIVVLRIECLTDIADCFHWHIDELRL